MEKTYKKSNRRYIPVFLLAALLFSFIFPAAAADTTQRVPPEGSAALALTEEERAFIDSGTEVTVGFNEECEPLAFVRKDGSYAGVYPTLITRLRELSGLNLILRPVSPDKDWKELVRNGELDFFIGTSETALSGESGLSLTSPFLTYSNILVTRNDRILNGLGYPTVAMTPGRANWAAYLEERLGRKIEVVYYETVKDCMTAVVQKKADASLINNLQFNYQSKNDRLSTLIQWPQLRTQTDVVCAASDQADGVMLSAFNKALGLLSANYVESVVDMWLNIPYGSYSAIDYLYKARPTLIVLGIVLLAASVIAALVCVFRRRQQELREQAQERERHQLQIVAALSRDYTAIYYTDLDGDRCELVRLSKGDAPSEEKSPLAHSETLRRYVEHEVRPEYQEALLKLCDAKEIIRRFQDESSFSIRYQVNPRPDHSEYFEMHFVDIGEAGRGHTMVLGILCVDDAVRDEMEHRQALQDALDGATRASAAKSEFLSRMSHDIRTPMNAIIGMTAIASAHAEEPDRVLDALDKISGASHHLLGLINDVLDMSKIESGKLSLNEEEIDLPDLVDNLLIMIQPQIKQHHHELQIHIQNVQHEAVIGDSLRIQQVFVNIMSNAVKYTPDGGKISLTVHELPISTSEAGCYQFIFQDNGIGMSKEDAAHIFDPFVRATNSGKIQGTGLGMAISRNIVGMMNGSIQVESELDKGSTFTVTIFLKLQDPKDLDISELAGLPVLVVDDDPDSCEAVCELLDELGMHGESYITGQSAVDAVRRSLDTESHFYAAILDWKMPEMDGLETAKSIKRLCERDIPIIILSAYDWSDIEMEARAAGVDAFLSKPVFKSGLIRLFKKLRNEENASARVELKPIEETNFKGRRILLVEDNALNREVAREILEMADIEVEDAEDGRQGVDKFAAAPAGYYDMILMDIQMPVMNGYEATMAIRALRHPDAQHIPIVAMTANAFVEDIQSARSAGMNAHIAKPIDFAKLGEILKKYLG